MLCVGLQATAVRLMGARLFPSIPYIRLLSCVDTKINIGHFYGIMCPIWHCMTLYDRPNTPYMAQ